MFTNVYVAVKFLLFSLFLCMLMHVKGGGVGETASNLSFSSDLMRGVHASLTDQEKRKFTRSLGEGGERKIIF